MTVKQKKSIKKTSGVKIDKRLDKLSKKVLFPEKLEKANEMIKKTGLPERFLKTAR